MRISSGIKLAALLLVSWLVVACNKSPEAQTASGAVVLSELTDPRDIVKQYVKYKKYDSENECQIRVEDGISFCVKIDQAIITNENGVNHIYAVENGYPLDENNKKANFHVSSGSIKFFKFELGKDNKLKLMAESDVVLCGPYGSVCSGITFKYGKGPELAWYITNGDMHQGYLFTSMTLLAPIKNKILPVLELQTSYSNEGAFQSDDPNAEISNISSKVKTIPDSGDDFYDLSVLVTEKNIKNKKETASSQEFTLKFDKKTLKYDTKDIAKVFQGSN